ncbi:NAD-dependent epimerase/dehydratase family protein [Ruminococcaceae bacterium OttesenSCG-928-O06]|nr:NAD-dependent epimerase/dehydratase family protein [Ruminococcaceae bacterium OttesenSCG-928-O06]
MERIYLITGANGHLGSTVARQLATAGQRVRALVLPGEATPLLAGLTIETVRGDVRDAASLAPLFRGLEGLQVVVIHAAAIIDITSNVGKTARDVNVGGTKNMVRLALAAGVHRFLHISSVHAIPEAPGTTLMRETKVFSPALVQGGYAKTKAEASRYVMDCVQTRGLPAVILHPSGIIGPGDTGTNNVVAALRSYVQGHLPACPRGGYNLVDVRDVAAAIIAAADKARVGETYILAAGHYEFCELFAMARQITGKGRRCPVVPMWMARLAAPLLEKHALWRGRPPLVTAYSLGALASNDNFSHEKAARELCFAPRPIQDTLRDTLGWISAQAPAVKRRRPRAV